MKWNPGLLFALLAFGLFLGPSSARAENALGGHFGVVFPLVTHADGETTDITDDFTVAFPMGITVKKSDRWAFDLELVAAVQDEPLDIGLTIHPGVIRSFGGGYAAGLRLAFDVEGDAWGLTPLVAKAFPLEGRDASLFVEADLPIRVREDAIGDRETAVTFALHFGIGF